jgi:glyoxylate carboligase
VVGTTIPEPRSNGESGTQCDFYGDSIFMRRSRALNAVYIAVLISIVIATAFALSYSGTPYIGIVDIGFNVQVAAYNQDGGDYAFIRFDGLMINFTRTMPRGLDNPNIVFDRTTHKAP